MPAPRASALILASASPRRRELLKRAAVAFEVRPANVPERREPGEPPALFAQGAIDMSDGQMFRIITAGQGNMAPHATQVARADRWRVIRFVRSLQPK